MKKIVTLALFTLCLAGIAGAKGLPFIRDDYRGALAQAKQRQLPIFVEVWAPW